MQQLSLVVYDRFIRCEYSYITTYNVDYECEAEYILDNPVYYAQVQ